MKMKSHICSATAMSWVEKMTVVPSFFRLQDGVAEDLGVDRVEAAERLVEQDQLAAGRRPWR